MSSSTSRMCEVEPGPGEDAYSHTRPRAQVQFAVTAQLHLALEAAHECAVGHALLRKVFELVQDDLAMHHDKALHQLRLEGQGDGWFLALWPADDDRCPCKAWRRPTAACFTRTQQTRNKQVAQRFVCMTKDLLPPIRCQGLKNPESCRCTAPAACSGQMCTLGNSKRYC